MAILELKNVHKTYNPAKEEKGEILDNINLNIEEENL